MQGSQGAAGHTDGHKGAAGHGHGVAHGAGQTGHAGHGVAHGQAFKFVVQVEHAANENCAPRINANKVHNDTNVFFINNLLLL